MDIKDTVNLKSFFNYYYFYKANNNVEVYHEIGKKFGLKITNYNKNKEDKEHLKLNIIIKYNILT